MLHTLTLARNAMHTRFELLLHGSNPVALRAAGEEALEEVDRLEAQLSLFRADSEIAHLNAQAARQPVRVTPATFALLKRAQRLHAETGGAFDITLAPLLRCWGLLGSAIGRVPASAELAAARARVGMHLVELDEAAFTVRFARPGVMLDLGAIGKGHAVERAAEILREAGVTSALVHAGTSTAYAIGAPPQADAWRVAVEVPPATSDRAPTLLATVPLRDESMSVSAVWGKSFAADGRVYGHVLDPATGEPAGRAVLAAVVLPSATETDALSTALLALGVAGHGRIAGLRAGIRTLVAGRSSQTQALTWEARGICLSPGSAVAGDAEMEMRVENPERPD